MKAPALSLSAALTFILVGAPLAAQQGFRRTTGGTVRILQSNTGGDNYHSGGRRWMSQDNPEWQMLADWVRGDTPSTCSVADK